jgi:hypothetical protein
MTVRQVNRQRRTGTERADATPDDDVLAAIAAVHDHTQPLTNQLPPMVARPPDRARAAAETAARAFGGAMSNGVRGNTDRPAAVARPANPDPRHSSGRPVARGLLPKIHHSIIKGASILDRRQNAQRRLAGKSNLALAGRRARCGSRHVAKLLSELLCGVVGGARGSLMCRFHGPIRGDPCCVRVARNPREGNGSLGNARENSATTCDKR